MYACAVDMFAPVMPPIMRPTNTSVSVSAKPITKYPTAEPSKLTSRIGRRPYISDKRPKIGEKTNCIHE